MKKIHLFLLIPVIVYANAWVGIEPRVVETSLRDVFFIDADIGWACGDSGVILKTINGGDTWARMPVQDKSNLISISFGSSSHGAAVGEYGVILLSSDGGSTWTKQSKRTDNTCYKVEVFGNDTLWIGARGYGGLLMCSFDWGSTWTSITTNPSDEMIDCDFVNGSTGYVVGYQYKILKTADFGRTWTPIRDTSDHGYMRKVEVIPSGGVFVIKDDLEVLRTMDDGETWNAKLIDSTYIYWYVQDIEFMNNETGYVLSGDSKNRLYRTTNSGIDWEIDVDFQKIYDWIYSITLDPNGNLWAVGTFGSIYKSSFNVNAITSPRCNLNKSNGLMSSGRYDLSGRAVKGGFRGFVVNKGRATIWFEKKY